MHRKCWAINELISVVCDDYLIFVQTNRIVVYVHKQYAHSDNQMLVLYEEQALHKITQHEGVEMNNLKVMDKEN